MTKSRFRPWTQVSGFPIPVWLFLVPTTWIKGSPWFAATQSCPADACKSFWTYSNKPRSWRKICFLHCSGNTVGKSLECFSKIVYRFENCLGFAIASVVCLFVSSHFLKKFNKHFAEEQNNWSHTCGFPDLFYMCVQYSVTQNMLKPSASNHLGCCGQDQSPTQGSTQGPGPHHSPAPNHRAGGQILAPVTQRAPSWPTPEAPVTGSRRRLKTQPGVH